LKSTATSTEPTVAVAPRPRALAQTASYYAAFAALGLIAAVLGPTLPNLAEHAGTQVRDISILFTVRSLGYLLGSLQSGFLYDRYRGNPIMAAVIVCIAALMALIPLAPLLSALIAIFLLIGVAEGALDVGGNALLIWTYRDQVGPYMNGLHFCFGVGAFLAPIIVAQVVAFGGASLGAYWVLALLIIPAALALLWAPSPAPQHHTHADAAIGRIDYRLAGLIALFFVLYVGAEVGFGGWVFSYAEALALTDTASAAYLTSAFWGALTFGRLLSIPLAARLRPRTILLGDLLGCLASLAIMVLLPRSLAALWAGTLGLGLSMASIFPTMMSFAARRLPTTGKVTSWFLVGASLGAMTLPWLIGQLFGVIGPRVTMEAILADLLVACVVFGLLMRYGGAPKIGSESGK
jgi:MFS transporter, FHS family, Na+ dependent glucose transporter 1